MTLSVIVNTCAQGDTARRIKSSGGVEHRHRAYLLNTWILPRPISDDLVDEIIVAGEWHEAPDEEWIYVEEPSEYYGPGQALDNPYTGVIANFARWLLADEPPTVYEDGQQTRDFVYIDDVADATTLAALDEVPSGAYNVATGEATTIESVARTLADALGKDIEPNITGEKRAGDIRHCTGDPSKLADLGWHAQWSFEDGIEEYARWLTQSK